MSVFSDEEKDQLEEYLFRLRDNAIKQAFDAPIIPFD
jgi:hypothetical protein